MHSICTFGSNAKGQLGIGNFEDAFVPTKMRYRSSSSVKFPIRGASGGASHTIIVDGVGDVWACGSNEEGQCGLYGDDLKGCDDNKFTELVKAAELCGLARKVGVEFVNCWCGWDTTIILDSSGSLWCFGSNLTAQCGVDPNTSKKVRPSLASRLSFDGMKFTEVSCGVKHIAAITADSRVYGWGSLNKYGELPNKEYINKIVLPTILDVPPAKGVACGLNYTAILTMEGEVIIYGRNKHIQVRRIGSLDDRFSSVYALWNTVIILSSSGSLSGVGRNDYKQMGFLESQEHECARKRTDGAIKQISVGSEYCLALFSCGCAVSWGWNEHGNCGSPPSDSVPYLRTIEMSDEVSLVACGAGHSIIVITETTCTRK